MSKLLKRIKAAIKWRVNALVRGSDKDVDGQFNAVHSYFLKNVSSPVIFDVGAHHGESLVRFRKLFPGAVLHAFEPDEDNFSHLQKNWGGKAHVNLNNAGVSSTKGKLTFYRNLKSNTSGFHAVNVDSQWAKVRSARQNVSPEDFTQKSYDVPVIDLDSYVAETSVEHIHLLKLDTQGHEDEVLKGSRHILEKSMVDVIETELIVGDAYTKSLSFSDIEALLLPYGYSFFGLDKHGDRLSTPSLSFNVIYVSNRLLSEKASDERQAA